MSALHYAARQGAMDAVRALASASGIDLDQADPDGINALLYATLNGHYQVAAYLLERGANPNIADQWGRAVLFAAVDMHLAEPEPRPPARATRRPDGARSGEAGDRERRGFERADHGTNSQSVSARLPGSRTRGRNAAVARSQGERRGRRCDAVEGGRRSTRARARRHDAADGRRGPGLAR